MSGGPPRRGGVGRTHHIRPPTAPSAAPPSAAPPGAVAVPHQAQPSSIVQPVHPVARPTYQEARPHHSPASSGGTGEKSPSPTSSDRLGRDGRRRDRINRRDPPSPPVLSSAPRDLTTSPIMTRVPAPGMREAMPPIGTLSLVSPAARCISDEEMSTRPVKFHQRKTGSQGQAVKVIANYVEIHSNWDAFVALFDVQFQPDEPNRKLRREFVEQLLRRENIVAPSFVYNGRNMIFMRFAAAALLQRATHQMTFARGGEAQGVTCLITLARMVKSGEPEIDQFLNNMKNHWLQDILQLAMLGRSHYDPSAVIKVLEGNARIHLWPGFETSFANYDGGKLFNVDARFKVIRDTTMAMEIQEQIRQALRNRMNQQEAQYAAAEAMVGIIVITKYSDKPRTYRVMGLDFTKNVEYKFLKGTQETTLRAYFQTKYGITIKDASQPLILAEETGQARFKVPGQDRKLYLVPELCHPTGLTDEMRANFRLMKTMAEHTLQPPENRRVKTEDFMAKLLSHPDVEKFTDSWQLGFANDLMTVNARQMQPVALQQGYKKFSYQLPRGMDLRSGKFHVEFRNPQGIFFAYPADAGRLAYQFLEEMKLVGRPMGWNPPETERYEYDNDRNIVIVMLQTKHKGRYDEIKYLLCKELPVLSQCVVRKTLENQKNLKTVATKIAMQIGCKLGGAPWALDVSRFNQRANIMFLGVDTFHDSGAKGGTRAAVAVVGTMDTASTMYVSRAFFQNARQEIGDQLANCVGYMLEEYKATSKEKRYPDTVIFYRDGVGAGQLKAVCDNEVCAIEQAIKAKSATTLMAFVVVTKRHNTRFMVESGKEMQNPNPGVVVDEGVTKPNRMDFYIVAQSVRQGTVSPTYYNVIYDSTLLTVDQIQQLTYAQCCMYFNWTGPVKVPAPCQYAHKLAFLIGQSIHDSPSEEMSNFLYYL
ncbi:Piwi-like protein 1 [Hypsibius exemplaris]|uniref:Piwi-like protein 1 n=1 Tax=Hypsibius exemplaris TaxID=2072580 RepID=A0A1W0WCW8_HYPEX|nr:Piwi-like protein 1 [Hypsibius exemplaris]